MMAYIISKLNGNNKMFQLTSNSEIVPFGNYPINDFIYLNNNNTLCRIKSDGTQYSTFGAGGSLKVNNGLLYYSKLNNNQDHPYNGRFSSV
jgi:hypothetical protein